MYYLQLKSISQGLEEFDRVMSNIEKADLDENPQRYVRFQKELDEILARYF